MCAWNFLSASSNSIAEKSISSTTQLIKDTMAYWKYNREKTNTILPHRNNVIISESCIRFSMFIALISLSCFYRQLMLLSAKYTPNLHFYIIYTQGTPALFQLDDIIFCRHYLKSHFSQSRTSCPWHFFFVFYTKHIYFYLKPHYFFCHLGEDSHILTRMWSVSKTIDLTLEPLNQSLSCFRSLKHQHSWQATPFKLLFTVCIIT